MGELRRWLASKLMLLAVKIDASCVFIFVAQCADDPAWQAFRAKVEIVEPRTHLKGETNG